MISPLQHLMDGDSINVDMIEPYFAHLATSYGNAPKLDTPGKIVIGLGSGRCGSSTLAGIMRNVDGCMATHENPPQLSDVLVPEHLTFHLMRFGFLSQYHPIVFDIAPNWIHYVGIVGFNFKDTMIIALKRDIEATIKSFDHVHHNFAQGVRRYVEEYHQNLDTMMSQSHPSRFLMARTEDLSLPETQASIFEFLRRPGRYEDVRNNVGVRRGRRTQDLWF